MLTQYRIYFDHHARRVVRPEWGYALYAVLLEHAPPAFAEYLHQSPVTPISQFLYEDGGGNPVWVVNLLGNACEDALSDYLDRVRTVTLNREQVILRVSHKERRFIPDVETLLSASYSYSNFNSNSNFNSGKKSGVRTLRFLTPTAFKSREQYRNFPDSRLILQSLIKKWNGCVSDCPIEDEDGQGVETMADGLLFRRFRIQDSVYVLKRNEIPGFIGEISVENHLNRFQRPLADALLTFSNFAGIGIKTALGMGGIELF